MALSKERLAKPLPGLPSWLPFLVTAILFVLGLYLLTRLLHETHLSEIIAQIRNTPPLTLGLALAATFASYLCLAGYDWCALRHIGKPLPGSVVLGGGLVAYAFGNTIGLTAISGGAVRWRLYSGLGLDGYDIAAISAYAAAAFGIAGIVVGLLSIALFPGVAGPIIPWSADTVRLLALASCMVLALPLLYASLSGRSLALGRRFKLRAPRPLLLVRQMLISAGDISFAALTLYLLIGPADLPFFGFLAIFAAAVLAGMISQVPGGIGIFETVIIAALSGTTPPGQIAGALLLYRLIYYLIPFALSLLFMTLHILWQKGRRPQARVFQVMAPALRALAPQVLAVTTLGMGLLLTTSVMLPVDWSDTLAPLVLLEGSTLLSSLLGSALIILSLGIARRSFAAYWLVLAAMAAAVMMSLLQQKGAQATILALCAGLLLPLRQLFTRRALLTHSVLTPEWAILTVTVLAGLGFTLFFAHKSTPYAHELWWQFATEAQAPRALRAGLLTALAVGLSGLFLLLRAPAIRSSLPDAATLATVADIVAAGDDPDAGFALTGDKSIILADPPRAFVMYGTSGRFWMAFGGPVGKPDAAQDAAFDFVDAARRAGADPAFYEVCPADLPIMLDLGMTLYRMGEEALVDLRSFSLEGSGRKRLRALHGRAQRKGLTLEITAPPHSVELIGELQIISDQWLAAGKAREKGFSVGRFSAAWLQRWPLALVRDQGRIVAFANIMTTNTRQRATIDMMRYSADAPPGSMDFLFISLMLKLKEQDFASFSLGMAPLSGLAPEHSRRLWERFGALIYRHGGPLYNFSGLRAFKEKFDPVWQPRYLATTATRLPLMQLAAAARLISGKPASIDHGRAQEHGRR